MFHLRTVQLQLQRNTRSARSWKPLPAWQLHAVGTSMRGITETPHADFRFYSRHANNYVLTVVSCVLSALRCQLTSCSVAVCSASSIMKTPDPSPIEQHNITVTRTARFAVIGSLDARSDDVWFVCHGFGQLAVRFISRFSALASDTRVIIAPEALSRYYLTAPTSRHAPKGPVGASWMTAEDRLAEIADYVGYLDKLYDEVFASIPRAKARVTVLGFSQGVATACRWLAAGRAEADRVILWAGMLPPELDARGAARLVRSEPLTMVVGRSDHFATADVVATEEARLLGLGVPSRTVWFDGGHEVVTGPLLELARE